MAQRTKRRRWPWVLLSLIVIAGGIFFAKRSGAKPAPLDPALMLTVSKRPMRLEILETGRIHPREKVEIKSKVAGQVASVRAQEGQHVDKGQLLLDLDPLDTQRDVAKAAADVASAKNAVDFAKVVLERASRGVDSLVMSRVDLDAATYDLRAKEATLRTMQVVLSATQDRLRYTRIYAPMSGTVIQRGIEPGEAVVPGVMSTFDGKALMTIADLSTLIVKVNLNQIDVAKVAVGRKAVLTLDALPGKTYDAVITKIAPASVKPPGKDQEVFPVEALLEKVDETIKPGMTADVRILLDEKAASLALPIEAVTKEGGKSFVTRVLDEKTEKQRTERVEVTVGARNDREIEILSGVAEGDRVLVKPASASENETKL